MPYLIDGHNLIPHIPGLSLSDLDDEIGLIHSLQKFANKRRTKVEVYFDQAPPTHARRQNHGLVTAVFIRQESNADIAIKIRLSQLGKQAKNWTVVSSDRDIIAEAKSSQSRLIKSAEFAKLIQEGLTGDQPGETENEDSDQPNLEVDYWLDQFSQE